MIDTDCTYEGVRRVIYGGGATFVPVCENCGRFVKEDENITLNGFDELVNQLNATCSKCGRTKMLFEGFIEEEPCQS